MIESDEWLLPESLAEEQRRILAETQARRAEKLKAEIAKTGSVGVFQRWFEIYRDVGSGDRVSSNSQGRELEICLAGLNLFLGDGWKKVYNFWIEKQNASKSV